MRAELTEEQTLLRETVARLLADTYPFEARRALLHSPDGWSRDLWSAMAELGLLSLAVPEEAGGLNAGGIELAIVAEALGAALSAEPVLPTAVSAVRMLAATGRMDTLEALTSGQSIVSVGTETWLEVAADGHLTAELVSVPWANTAERLLLFVQGPDGTALIAVDTDRPEITRRAHRTFDGLAAADVNIQALNMGTTDVLADGDAARQYREARTLRELWLAAEAVGLMQVALDATVEHLKSRYSSANPWGNFKPCSIVVLRC
ncbi:MAG: acyl-CoA dehydrogenase family protein [Brevundimonas sp.]|nr:MAG: acyl-CoA dehydrogenase family protein [Brevundimonas sp.]